METLNNPKSFAIKLLNEVIKDKNGEIKTIKPIHNGYTNQSFYVEYANGKKYQVRIPHCGDLINRTNEYQVLTMTGQKDIFPYFDIKTGIAIKKWLPGSNPKIKVLKVWKHVDQLFAKIKALHNMPLPTKHSLKPLNLDAYNENLFHLKLKYQTKYLEIVDLYRDDPMVLNHTDINSQNILIDDNDSIRIIDFEWCGLASDYWDYANFIREEGLRYSHLDWEKYIKGFDMKKLKDYIFATAVSAYLWTWAMPQTRKMIRYRRKVLRQVAWYSKGVIDHGTNK